MAYARHLIEAIPDRLNFAAATSWGRLGPIATPDAFSFISLMDRRWRGSGPADTTLTAKITALARRLNMQILVGGESTLYRRENRRGGTGIYLLVSHHHLDRSRALRQFKERTGRRFVCLIHDLIPIEFPEYARPGQAARHFRRMETAATLSDAVITNSRHTANAFGRMLKSISRDVPVLASPLGIDIADPPTQALATAARPYFVCIATIEPKKNHLLLLNVWRRLALAYGPATPRLILVGQRGWENENVIDMIERSMPLRGLIEEHSTLSDAEMQQLLRGAKALLLPSFAEGYGLPVAEALAIGAPVICSDLPALRETAANVPEYLDPLDGPAWAEAILDYTEPSSPRRAAQLKRLERWPRPTWSDHFARVFELFGSLERGPEEMIQPAVAAGR